MMSLLTDYYRLPGDTTVSLSVQPSSGESGFFRFGPNATCFGKSACGVSESVENVALNDASKSTQVKPSEIRLAFDPAQIVDNLRLERYVKKNGANGGGGGGLTPASTSTQH